MLNIKGIKICPHILLCFVLAKRVLQSQAVFKFCQLLEYEISFTGTIVVLLETQKFN